ncbi:MAG: response regulator [Fischerella sp. CENA71]|nr:response regulator [Fischerella sp. CENA71]
MVDDNEIMRVVIPALLESYGIQVITASNARAGFELIKQHSVNLLISDITMPGESGYCLIEKIRSLKLLEKRDIPAIALTGNIFNQVRLKALKAGFQIYMEKPFEPEQLIKEVAKLLELPVNTVRLNLAANPA